jgi:cytochrome c2
MVSRVFLTVVAVAWASSVSLAAQDPKQVELGKKLYETYNCKKCHRINGVGSKVSPLDGVATKKTPDEIREWLVSPVEMTKKLKKKPSTPMKKQDYKPGEVDAVMAFLSTLK